MEIKDTFLVKYYSYIEFINEINRIIKMEQEKRRIVDIAYAPVVEVKRNKVLFTAFITSRSGD